MADFTYRARSADGAGIEGTVQAPNAETAAQDLCDAGLTPIEIRYADGRFNYDVSLQKGVTGEAPTWGAAQDDGTVAVWRTPGGTRRFGVGILLFGALWVGIAWHGYVSARDGLARFTGTLCPGGVGLLLVLIGVRFILKKDRMVVDRTTGTLQRLGTAREGDPTFKTADVQKVTAAWVFKVEKPQRSSASAESRNRSLCLVAEVSLIKRNGQAVRIEYCSDGEHASALAAKVAEYLQVPLEDTLDAPVVTSAA